MVDDPMLRPPLPAPRVAQAAMFSLIPEDWGGHVSPWVKEISQYFDSLKSLHFRHMIVKDSDLQNLARDRGHVLHALKLDKCFSFTTDGLFHIGRFCKLVILIAFLAILTILSRTCVPWLLKLMISLSSQTNELYQLASVAFCLLVAWVDKLGLSLELDSFATGVMISTTDLGQHTLEQVEPIRNFFAALFLASIGMLIHVHFLWNHVDILLAVVILVIIIKTIVTISVVKGFGYNNKTSLFVRFDNNYYNYICLLITSYISLTEEP
ncbi:hypothetical protein JHK87_033803 [Glycine soja]|nr:hypothetical protein JHK87_033803 [Glycine soja]